MTSASHARFSNRAELYSKYRPTYPSKILDVLRREIGFRRQDVVADIGSGTGLLSRLFLSNGNKVFAIEPNANMRSYAERDLSGFENFVSLSARAERTTLRAKSIDLITTGEALHWFDSLRTAKEFSRIAKPDGHLCVVYTRTRKDQKFNGAYRRFARRYEKDLAKVPDMSPKLASPYFDEGKCTALTLPNEQTLDFQGLKGRLLSMSFMPTPEEASRSKRFEKAIRKLFDSYESRGCVRLLYETTVLVGKLPG